MAKFRFQFRVKKISASSADKAVPKPNYKLIVSIHHAD